MVSKSINNILERLDKVHERMEPVLAVAERLARIEEKLDQLLAAQGKPAAQTARTVQPVKNPANTAQSVDMSRASQTQAHKLDAGKKG